MEKEYWLSETGLIMLFTRLREVADEGRITSDQWDQNRGTGYPSANTLCRYFESSWVGVAAMAGLSSGYKKVPTGRPTKINGGKNDPVCECFLVDGGEEKAGVKQVWNGKGYLWLCQECLDYWNTQNYKFLEEQGAETEVEIWDSEW